MSGTPDSESIEEERIPTRSALAAKVDIARRIAAADPKMISAGPLNGLFSRGFAGGAVPDVT